MASALRTSLCQTLRKRDAPEAARCAALQGAELLVYPTAIGNVDS
jgi:predicted amidohydrolase